MDSAYLKQTVGEAVASALSDLLLHGPSQTHPSLSTNPETNPLSTSQDPVTYIARYLINYHKSTEAEKKLSKEQDKISGLINAIHAQEAKMKAEEAAADAAEQAKLELAAARVAAPPQAPVEEQSTPALSPEEPKQEEAVAKPSEAAPISEPAEPSPESQPADIPAPTEEEQTQPPATEEQAPAPAEAPAEAPPAEVAPDAAE